MAWTRWRPAGVAAAVEQVFAGVRQGCQQGVCLGRQRMFVRSARTVDPPDLALAAGRRELVQHGQHRRDADARGDEQDRAGAVVQDEVAAGCGHVQDRAGLQVAVQVAAGRAVRLLLDADPVGAGAGAEDSE